MKQQCASPQAAFDLTHTLRPIHSAAVAQGRGIFAGRMLAMTKGLVCLAGGALLLAFAGNCASAEPHPWSADDGGSALAQESLPQRASEFSVAAVLGEADVASVDYLAEEPAESLMDACDCGACRGPRWFAGTEVTFLGIDVRTGGRVTLSFDDSDTAGTELAILDGNGMEDFGYAPRIWLGRNFGDRWGAVVRYWNLTDHAASAPALVPGTTELPNFATTTNADKVELETLDIEGIRTFTPGRWKIDGSMGARYASISTESAVTAFGVVTSGNFVNMLLSNGSSFTGAGLTGGMTFRRPIGNSCAHLFLSGRGSAMWGHSDSFGRAAGAVASSPSSPLVGAATVTRNNAVASATIAEFQVGVQLEFQLHPWPMHAFLRTAFESQHWNIDGPPTGGAGFGGTINDLTTNSFSSAGLPDAKLYGLSLATGFTW
jgi:hypothetical protein